MRKKIAIFITGMIATLIFLVFTWDVFFKYFSVLPKLNHVFYDASLKIFHKTKKSDTIVIVDVDEKSLKNEGRWPWSRSKIAAITKVLQEDGAAVIAFDVLFPEVENNIASVLLDHVRKTKSIAPQVANYLSQNIDYFDNDKLFADRLAKSDVVLGVFFDNELYHSVGSSGKPIITFDKMPPLIVPHMKHFIGSIPELVSAAKYTGFTTTIPDEDGTIRRSPLLIEYDEKLYPALALEAVRLYLLTENVTLEMRDFDKNKVLLGVRLGGTYIPTDFSGNILVSYIGPAYSFSYVSATDVLAKKFPPQTFMGKLVIFGSSAVGVSDSHPTPIQSASYPGCEIHASIAESILSGNIISSPIWLVGAERIMIVMVGLLFIVFALDLSVFGLFFLTFGIEFLLFILHAFLWIKWKFVFPHIILPYSQILFLGIINSGYGYLFETRYRKRLHDVYGQYVSSAHIDRMLEDPSAQHTMAGRTKMMTVLFADVRSFTSISEKLDANGVKKFLNALFTPLTEIIFEYKGTIDKYVGDMIMAFWNDPVDDEKHAEHTVQAALAMQNKVKELAGAFVGQGIDNVGIRIGINSGIMHVGDMGSKYRKAYTVLGDAVNLASRLESANKFYGTKILLAQETKDLCSGIVFRFIDRVCVKGKREPINIYEPLCTDAQATAELISELALHEKAMVLYRASDWCAAKEAFAELVAKYPQTEAYSVHFERLKKYADCPPKEGWESGYHMSEK